MLIALQIIAAGLVAALADWVWLGRLGSHQVPELGFWRGALTYLALGAGLVLVVAPLGETVGEAALWGAAFGGLTHALYAGATRLGWKLALAEAAWGAALCALLAALLQRLGA